MVVFGGEYVTTYCWHPGVPTRFVSFTLHFNITDVEMLHQSFIKRNASKKNIYLAKKVAHILILVV